MSRIFFGTNRDPVLDGAGNVVNFGKNFSAQGLNDLRFGVCEVQDWKMVSVSCFPEDAAAPGSQAVFSHVKDLMKAGTDTLVMIHGYATTFQQAIEGAAKTLEAYKAANLNIILFSWPSDGAHAPKDYGNDRLDAHASGPAFARGLLKLVEFLGQGDPCGRKIHLLAHSMGNYVLRNALQELQGQMSGSRMPCVFENIFSMAADEDSDALDSEEKWKHLPDLCRSLNIYINKYDKALLGSNLTKGNPERMGNFGPDKPMDLPAKVTVIDVSADMGLTDVVGHGYYDEHPRVIDDVLMVLAGTAPSKVTGRTWVPSAMRFTIQ